MFPSSRPFKRRFSPAEDAALCNLVTQFGTAQWNKIAEFIPERTARQCRDRYEHYLMLNANGHPWTPDEDARLGHAAQEYGHRWKEIAAAFPGRNANSLKNRWHKVVARIDKRWADELGVNDPASGDVADPHWDTSVIDEPFSFPYCDFYEESLHNLTS
jgi:hypothetical protein